MSETCECGYFKFECDCCGQDKICPVCGKKKWTNKEVKEV